MYNARLKARGKIASHCFVFFLFFFTFFFFFTYQLNFIDAKTNVSSVEDAQYHNYIVEVRMKGQ